MKNKVRQVRTESRSSAIIVVERIIVALFSVIEFILGLRLVFKMLGANPGNGFVKLLYNITAPFVNLFAGIFNNISLGGESPAKVIEPGTIIAIIVVAFVAWLVRKLIHPRLLSRTEQTEYIETNDEADKP